MSGASGYTAHAADRELRHIRSFRIHRPRRWPWAWSFRIHRPRRPRRLPRGSRGQPRAAAGPVMSGASGYTTRAADRGVSGGAQVASEGRRRAS